MIWRKCSVCRDREKLGQEYLRRLAEDALNDYYDVAQGSISKYQVSHLYVNLEKNLQLDGYEYKDNILLIPERDVLDAQEESGVLQGLYVSLGLDDKETTFHHLKLSEDHYIEGRWDDTISNSRKFLECVLAQVAAKHHTAVHGQVLDEKTLQSPRQIRDYMEKEGLLETKEKEALDYDSIEPGEVWVGDHHQFNCMIMHRGNWVRPWITAWMDMRSRAIVGRHINTTPNQTTIMQAMKPAIQKFGLPELVKIDNGKDYDSEMFTGTTKTRRKRVLNSGYIDEQTLTGLYGMMQIQVSFSIAYHPQSKSIERFFDTLNKQFCKSMPTYCGKDSARKPEGLNKYLMSGQAIEDAYDLKSFTELIDKYIEVYNNSSHTGRGMEGATPMQVMNSRETKRAILERSLEYLLQVWSGEIKVGKNGVRFKNLYFGQYSAELARYQGKMVRVSYDPEDIRRVFVYEAETWKFITVAEQARLIRYHSPLDEEMLREAMRQKARIQRIHKEHKSSQRARFMDLPDLVLAALQEAAQEAPESKPVTGVKPVQTPIDGQTHAAKRRETQRKLKWAVGAEGQENFIDLQINYDSIKKDETPCHDLGLGLGFLFND